MGLFVNMTEEIDTNKINLPHHHQLEFCRTRPAYRQGRRLTAVKAYTINNESTHMLVFGVPKINLRQELKQSLQKYGKIKSLSASPIYPTEQFTECYHVNFENFQSARIAKKFIDMKNYYGGILHVCYAPELETIEETRRKLKYRMSSVKKRLISNSKSKTSYNNNISNMLIANNSNLSGISHNFLKDSDLISTSLSHSNGDISKPHIEVSASTTNNEYIDSFSHDPQKCNAEVDSSHSIVDDSTAVCKKPYHDEEYVFKRKKRRKSKPSTKRNSKGNLDNMDICVNGQQNNDVPILSQNEDGRVVVFQNVDKPVIINVPKKVTNKIIMKIPKLI